MPKLANNFGNELALSNFRETGLYQLLGLFLDTVTRGWYERGKLSNWQTFVKHRLAKLVDISEIASC